MGWLSYIAFTVIAITLVYNWLNKENERDSSREESLSQKNLEENDSTRTIESREITASEETSTMPSQSATQITISTSEPTDALDRPEAASNDNQDDKTQSQQLDMAVEASSMPPPPLPPTVTAAPTTPTPIPSTSTSTQRSRSPPRLKPPTIGAAPTSTTTTAPRPRGSGALRPPPSAASSLRVPPTKVLPNTSMAPSALMPPPTKKTRQVALEPGHSPLDWAALTMNPHNQLRGKDAPANLTRITPSQLKIQNGRKGRDAWTVFQGKVYNITPYVPFHPGGKGEILRGAAKDSAKLFMEVHPWVNWDGMLAECCVGIFVAEEQKEEDANRLDEMD